jgi:hypothetical protein
MDTTRLQNSTDITNGESYKEFTKCLTLILTESGSSQKTKPADQTNKEVPRGKMKRIVTVITQ